MTQLTIEELTEIARQFLRDEYGMALEIPIRRNNRLSISQGRFIEKYDKDIGEYVPHVIEISGKAFTYGADEAIIDVLKHECIHYALCVRGEPYDDGDEYFESELKRFGVSSTNTNTLGPAVVYSCNQCGKVDFTGSRRYVKALEKSTLGYKTRCCNATLTYIRTEIFDGTRSVDECLKTVY